MWVLNHGNAFCAVKDQLAVAVCSKDLLLLTQSAAAYTQSFLALVLVGKITTDCSGNWPNTLVSQLGLWWLCHLPDDIKIWLEGLISSSSFSSLPSGKFTELWVWCIPTGFGKSNSALLCAYGNQEWIPRKTNLWRRLDCWSFGVRVLLSCGAAVQAPHVGVLWSGHSGAVRFLISFWTGNHRTA